VEIVLMPVYGYSRIVVDPEFGLMELREVSFGLPPVDMRRVAAFLQHYADLIESGDWKSDHIHLESFDPQWRARQPDLQVVILNKKE
jgi:ferredoxin-NADP reductase